MRNDDKIWLAIDSFFLSALGTEEKAGIAIAWLLAQVLQPLSPEQSRAQSAQLLHAYL